MFSVCRPATWYRRQSFDSLAFAIQLVEDHVARTAALSARLATAGHADAAIYARASLELGQLYLDLLRRGQFRLLMVSGSGPKTVPQSRPLSSTPLDLGARQACIDPAQ